MQPYITSIITWFINLKLTTMYRTYEFILRNTKVVASNLNGKISFYAVVRGTINPLTQGQYLRARLEANLIVALPWNIKQ